MEMLFTLKQMRQFIQGEDNEPQEIFAGEGDLRVVTNQELINQWKTTDCYGRFLIFNCCDETRKLALHNCRTSYDMWTRLETQYLQRAADNKHLLHRDFMNLRPVDNQGIMSHITELESKAAELNDLGVMVTEHHLITTILCSLPERFANLTSIWDNLPDADRTMEALRAQITGEERRFNNSQGHSSSRSLSMNSDTRPLANSNGNSALIGNESRGRGHFRGGRGQSRGHISSGINRDLVSCSYCGKDRHLEFECRTRNSNENEKTKSSSFHYKRPKDDRDPANSSGKKVDFSLISSCCLTATNSKDIYLDSGATRHMSGDESMLTDLRIIPDNSWPVNGIGGTVLYTRGIGTMRLVRHVGDSSTYGEVKEVLFVPGLGVNLISIGCLTKSGFKVSFSGLQAIIKQNKTIILTASRSGETLYRADATLAPPTEVCLAANTTVAILSTWHERFAHINSRAVHRMASGIGVNGMIVAPGGRKLHDSCHGCLLGKMHKQPFTHSNYTADSIGQLVVSDLVVPLQVNSVGGARYYMLFKDVHSKYKVVYFMERKSETADCFLDYAKKIKTQTGRRVQTLRCDGDKVYLNDYLKTALADLQINLQISAPYTPEQNGIAERDHRSTVESARSLLHSQGISLKLWAECINDVVYALNRSVYTPDVITPYQRWFGVKPDVSRLRVFGSVTYFLSQMHYVKN